MDPREQLTDTAHHEAGHAVAAKALGLAIPKWITIVPDGDTLGSCQSDDGMRWPELNSPALGREWVGRRAICFLAGPAAEERRTGLRIITVEMLLALPSSAKASRDARWRWDLNAADRVLRGFEPFERERGKWLAALWSRALRLIACEQKTVVGLAEALLAHRRLEGEAVAELLSAVVAVPLGVPVSLSPSP